MTPKRRNVEFFVTAAAAQQHGYRACKRCRPDASPGSPEWNVRADVVGRAMRLIADGLVDREGVGGLAARLNYSERQINRLLTTELGAGPLALARAQRAQTARTLIETTSMPITRDRIRRRASPACASSTTRFARCIASSPTELRGTRRQMPAGGTLSLRLAYRAPFHSESIFGFLGDRAVPGIETWDGVTYRRSLRLNHGNAVVAVSPGATAPGPNALMCTLHLDNVADAQAAVQRCRRMFDLDADPTPSRRTSATIRSLPQLVRKRPGLRSPGSSRRCRAADPGGARPAGLRQRGANAGDSAGGVARRATAARRSTASPTSSLRLPRLPGASPSDFAMPAARGRALINACAQLAGSTIVIDAGSDRDEISRQLESLPGIGPWTARLRRVACPWRS